MTLRNIGFAAALGLTILGGKAEASVLINIFQTSGGVVVAGGGAIDLTGLQFDRSPIVGATGLLWPSTASVVTGTDVDVDVYKTASGPTSFGSGGFAGGSNGSGDAFGIYQGEVVVPLGYMSGSPLIGSATFAGQTFKSLGLTPGTYVYTWNSSPVPAAFQDDSLTVNIAPIPEPATWAMMALGFMSLGVAGYRASRKNAALAA
jgi:hypothetical protein